MLPKTLTITSLCLAGILATGCAQLQENLESASASLKTSETTTETSSAPAVERPAPVETEPAAEEEGEVAAEVTSPVRITIDGSPDKAADQFGIYWESESRVSAEPHFTLTMDSELGDFQRLIINVYEADDDGRETGGPWAITDFGGEQLLVPNRSINLANPGDLTILSPKSEQIASIPFQSGKTYIALFVVNASVSSHTHKVRFTVR